MEETEIDCWCTPGLICPWCGHEHIGLDSDWGTQGGEMDCDECGKTFIYEVEFDPVYYSRKKEIEK